MHWWSMIVVELEVEAVCEISNLFWLIKQTQKPRTDLFQIAVGILLSTVFILLSHELKPLDYLYQGKHRVAKSFILDG